MPAEDPDAPPPRIPDFELLRPIGRGSYGEVWLARSVTGAWRAVKIIRRDRFDSARPYDREFEGIQKYEPVSRSAEGLVHLLHVSRGAEFFYYVMELADAAETRGIREPVLNNPCAVTRDQIAGAHQTPGREPPLNTEALVTDYTPRTLDTDLERHGRLTFAECLRIALALVKGLEHLHASGLIHRDIKPSNIIFVNGAPRLADIGLVTDADSTRTLVGTEGYLSPEGGGTPGGDLYSLGKVLYEIGTGQDRREFPVMPLDFAGWPDRAQVLELSEIFEKACEASPAERYGSAAELRADLELLMAGESVARRRRHAWFARQTGIVIAVGLLAAGLVTAGWFWRKHSTPSHTTTAANPNSVRASTELRLGRSFLEKRTPHGFSNALVHFDAALRHDPGSAFALAGRAEALALLATYHPGGALELWRESRRAAQAALKLTTNLAGAHLTLGLIQKNHEWDWASAERHFRSGLAADPNSAQGHQWLGNLLGILGRAEEAVAEARRAVELEPFSRSANGNLAIQLHLARRYEEAVTQYRRTLTLAPDFAAAREWLSRLLVRIDRPFEGFSERIAAFRTNGAPHARVAELTKARTEFGEGGFWRTRLRHVEEAGGKPALARAEAHIHLKNLPAAFAAIEDAVSHREADVLLIGVEPLYDPLRSNAAFSTLCARLRLPAPAIVSTPSSALGPLTEIDRAAGLTADEKASGFRPMFDGVTLDGWRSDHSNWAVVNGALRRVRPGAGKPSHLRYVAQTVPDDFEMRFEWSVETHGNSGVNYRPGMVEYQVIDNAHTNVADAWSTRAGSLYACLGQQNGDQTRPVGEWNEGRIICQGTTIEHWVNGEKQFRLDYRLPHFTNFLATLDYYENKLINTSFGNVRARGGYLSLQDQDAVGASFRRLRWRRLE